MLCAGVANAGNATAETAQHYLDAMLANQPDTQATLLADDAIFEDPMGITHGKQAIHEAWRHQGVRFLGFDQRATYASGVETFVSTGIVSFEQSFRTQDGKPLTFRFALECAIALTIRNGKVIRHVDYVDTTAFTSQLKSQFASMQAASP